MSKRNTRDVGPVLKICQLNVEGLSKSKSEYLSRLCIEEEIDVLLLQETHTIDDFQLEIFWAFFW